MFTIPAEASPKEDEASPPVASSTDEDDKDNGEDEDEDEDEDKDKDEDEEPTLELLTPGVPAILKGDTVWITALWTATGGSLENLSVTATGADVSYPANTAEYTSLMQDASLSEGEIDFTAIKIAIPNDGKDTFLTLKADWTWNGKKYNKILADGKVTGEAKLDVPTVEFTGDDVSHVDPGPVSVSQGGSGWIDITFAGNAPSVEDFQVTIDGPDSIGVEYPQTTHTSLVHDNNLEDGETDVARVYVDFSPLAPGDYQITVTARWDKGKEGGSLTGTMTLRVV